MKQKTYKLVNILVLLLTVLLLSRALLHQDFSFVLHNPLVCLIMIVTVILVHGIKVFRLYLELLDRKLPFGLFLRQYCKITPVSMILPLKAGDLFRCYCYGYYIGDWMYGIAVILLDRFVDTAALMTVLVLFVLPLGNAMPAVSFVLLAVLFALSFIYFALPGLCQYWNRYLIAGRGSTRKLFALTVLARLEAAYRDIHRVVQGKFLLSYMLSVVAWLVEIGGLALTVSLLRADLGAAMSAYLLGAMWGGKISYLSGIILFGTVLLLLLYLVTLLFVGRKERADEAYRNL
ncbi:hypothetical protein [Stomatobaculum longum]|uniref:hypothetical protein n=1 Tax=Stomatobaculum longum TaxID=796942 RepID=UPI002803DEB4|nr:hypothetical protein [Stomatobaculum longum]